MSAKSEEKSAMAGVLDTRNQVRELVERYEIQTRSTMLAYERVGQLIGRSSGWVRGFIGRDDRYNVSLIVALNIKSLYERACVHIEDGNEKMRRAENEAHQSNSGMHETTESAALLPPNEY
jgi:hypothetical protein